MQKIFADPEWIRENRIFIEGPDVNHIKNVLRMKPGEKLTVSDGSGAGYSCIIEKYEDGEAVLKICEKILHDTELESKIYLFQGLPKGEKMELIIQKAVELGVFSVIPFQAKRSVVKLDEKKVQKKTVRWQTIAKSAAEQSGRAVIPEIYSVLSYQDALKMAQELDVILIPYEMKKGMEETAALIRNIVPGQSVGIFIGPEGGFEEQEVDSAKAVGAHPVSLGKRILRTETAGIAALSILMYHLECYGHKL